MIIKRRNKPYCIEENYSDTKLSIFCLSIIRAEKHPQSEIRCQCWLLNVDCYEEDSLFGDMHLVFDPTFRILLIKYLNCLGGERAIYRAVVKHPHPESVGYPGKSWGDIAPT